jgi:protein SCO1/2
MKKKSSIFKIIILATILVLPGFLYYLLQEKGKNRYKPLDIYGSKQVASTFHTKRGKKIPDTIYHRIRNFKLLSSTGDSVGLPADSNRIVVVNFFYTKCKSVCPQMNTQLARVVAEYSRNKIMRFYSITVDPEHDTPEVLKAYAQTYKADPKKWSFLTGDKDLIFKLSKKDFLVDALATQQGGTIIHSPMLILVDPENHIRGYYDSTSKEQVDKLIDEIKVLIAEEARNTRISYY